MSAKLIKKPIEFVFPLNRRAIKDCRLHFSHIGDLHITGTATMDPNTSILDIHDRYSVEINSILWNGWDLRALFDAPQLEEILTEIEDAAIQHAPQLFSENVAA